MEHYGDGQLEGELPILVTGKFKRSPVVGGEDYKFPCYYTHTLSLATIVFEDSLPRFCTCTLRPFSTYRGNLFNGMTDLPKNYDVKAVTQRSEFSPAYMTENFES